MGVCSTFSLWNTTSLHIFYPRYSEEPRERQTCKMNDLIAGVVTPSSLLVEDIELGLCGTLLRIWEISRAVARFDELAHLAALNEISTRLQICKDRLDTTSALREHDRTRWKVLVRAYMGKESEDTGEQAGLERLLSLLADAALLHQFLFRMLNQMPEQIAAEEFIEGIRSGCTQDTTCTA